MSTTENMEYNTTRNMLVIREYGRNVQKMIEFLLTIEDREERQKNADTVIELMGMLNPHLRNVEDFRHKLWDHLYLISNYELDVDSPYPTPSPEKLKEKPDPLPYPKRYPKYKHFGKNLEKVVDKTLEETDETKREGLTQYIGNYMKLAYANWQKESMHDDMIRSELADMTKGELIYENDHSIQQPPENFHQTKRKNHPHKNKSNGRNKYKYKNRNK